MRYLIWSNSSNLLSSVVKIIITYPITSLNITKLEKLIKISQFVDSFLKGVQKKLGLKFCFDHISASKHQIFKILFLTPHNIWVVDTRILKVYRRWDMSKTKVLNQIFLHTLYVHCKNSKWSLYQQEKKYFHVNLMNRRKIHFG